MVLEGHGGAHVAMLEYGYELQVRSNCNCNCSCRGRLKQVKDVVSEKSIASYELLYLYAATAAPVNGRPADHRLHFTTFGVPTTWKLFSADDVLFCDRQGYAGRAERNAFARLMRWNTNSPTPF